MSSQEILPALDAIQAVARKMATCFQDSNAIWQELKALDSKTIKAISDHYKGTTSPVQMVREFVAWKLLEGAPWGNEQHFSLLEAIRKKDKEYFGNFRTVEFGSDTTDPFRTWANPARIYLPFLFPNETEVDGALQLLSGDLALRLGQPQLKFSLWDFNGSTNLGQDTAALALYPENRRNHQEAWQLFVKIRWDGLEYGLVAGKSLGKKDGTLTKVDSWDLVANGLTQLIPQFEARNKSLRRFLQWAPGEAAKYWDEFNQLGVVAMGWDELGDLTQFTSREALAQALGGVNPATSNEVMNLELFRDASVGDIVVAKQGRKAAVGIGILTGKYEFHPERTTYRHLRQCKWIVAKPIDFGISMFRADTFATTRRWPQIVEAYIKKYPELTDILKDKSANTIITTPNKQTTEEDSASEPSQLLSVNPTNIILYGPPGTGKTFSTIDWALALIEQKDLEVIQGEERDLRRERFQQLTDSGQVKFVTFHQSFSYEDFVEGIKPDIDGEEESIHYEIKPGLFRILCQEAEDNWRGALGQETTKGFDELWADFIRPLEEGPEATLKVPTPRGFFTITDVTNRTIRFSKMTGSSVHSLSISTLRQLFQGERQIPGGLSTYYSSLLEQLRKMQKSSKKSDPIKLSQYVLVIDEINRGNVAQILGELITLLEPDKRLGMNEPLTVHLPYSKKPFGIPPNLHIVGTMNTADRSVEALDTALRRRFIFKETMPDATLISLEACQEIFGDEWELEDLDLGKLLGTINNRLMRLLDRDHTIGHAFFMDVHDLDGLQAVFADKVIPLLQEFFYGDWSRIGLVLGGRFVQVDKMAGQTPFASFDADPGEIEYRQMYAITPQGTWDASAFKSVYADVETTVGA